MQPFEYQTARANIDMQQGPPEAEVRGLQAGSRTILMIVVTKE